MARRGQRDPVAINTGSTSGSKVETGALEVNRVTVAKFGIGQVVRHRLYPFRGIVYDIDPQFDNTEEWYESIPEHIRPRKDQPFYHLLAENEETTYLAYVSEQNLVEDTSGEPVSHPELKDWFDEPESGVYVPRDRSH